MRIWHLDCNVDDYENLTWLTDVGIDVKNISGGIKHEKPKNIFYSINNYNSFSNNIYYI